MSSTVHSCTFLDLAFAAGAIRVVLKKTLPVVARAKFLGQTRTLLRPAERTVGFGKPDAIVFKLYLGGERVCVCEIH